MLKNIHQSKPIEDGGKSIDNLAGLLVDSYHLVKMIIYEVGYYNKHKRGFWHSCIESAKQVLLML